MIPANLRLATPLCACVDCAVDRGRCLWFPLRMTFSNDPRDYTKEQLQQALLVAARLVADGSIPTWPFQLLEEALASHEKDDVRTRALKLAAQMTPAAP